jgi:hypothetical protein
MQNIKPPQRRKVVHAPPAATGPLPPRRPEQSPAIRYYEKPVSAWRKANRIMADIGGLSFFLVMLVVLGMIVAGYIKLL